MNFSFVFGFNFNFCRDIGKFISSCYYNLINCFVCEGVRYRRGVGSWNSSGFIVI